MYMFCKHTTEFLVHDVPLMHSFFSVLTDTIGKILSVSTMRRNTQVADEGELEPH